jgi:glycosyltransferase involved in cell wall biosynthesis
MDPKVCFITGVKNRSKELEEMIQSVLSQDMAEWELIIVDDHSDEPIEKSVEKFSDARIKFFKLPVGQNGISHARNLAVSHAAAPILLTADGDDISRPQRARRTCEIMAKENADVFYSDLEYFESGTNKRWTKIFQPFNPQLFRMFNFMTNPGTAFTKEIFLKAGGFDPSFVLSEDYDLYLRMLNLDAKFAYTDEILVNYRRDSGSASIKKYDQTHDYIMKARIKDNITPFNIEDAKRYALPEIAKNILSENGKKLWQDDRFTAEIKEDNG